MIIMYTHHGDVRFAREHLRRPDSTARHIAESCLCLSCLCCVIYAVTVLICLNCTADLCCQSACDRADMCLPVLPVLPRL